MFNCVLLGALKLFFLFCPFISFIMFLISAVPYIMSLFFIIYACSLFKPFFLLWSLFKCLFLLRSLVWPLLPRSILAILCIVSILTVVLISSLFYFFSFTEVYWLRSTILFWRPLWYSTCYRYSFVSIFYLVDPIIHFDCLIN